MKNKCEVCGKAISEKATKCNSCVKKGRIGPAASNWQGGEVLNSDGRVLIWIPPDDPLAVMRNGRGYCYRSRLVLAQHLGRVLKAEESIHHIDKDVSNDEIENLRLFPNDGHHQRFHRLQEMLENVNLEREIMRLDEIAVCV